MAVNSSVLLENKLQFAIDFLNYYQSIENSLGDHEDNTETLTFDDWKKSILNASQKDISRVLEGIESVKLHFPGQLNTKQTILTNSPLDIPSQLFSLSTFLLAIDGYSVSVIATVGIALNIFGIYFLSNVPRRRNIYNLILSSVLVFDAIFLLLELLKSIECHFISLSAKYGKIYQLMINSGIRFSMLSSIFMLVAIARIRLSAIRKPFQHHGDILTWKERRNKWLRYIIPTMIMSAVLTVPLIFGVEHLVHEEDDSSFNVTPSSLRLNPIYPTLYVVILNFVLTWLLPIAYLIYSTYIIRHKLSKRNTMLNSFGTQQMDQGFSNEDKATRTLLTIILCFMTLHAFRIVWIFGEIYILLFPNENDSNSFNRYGVPIWYHVIASLCEFFVVINSSVNVIIYLRSNMHELKEIVWVRSSVVSNNDIPLHELNQN